MNSKKEEETNSPKVDYSQILKNITEEDFKTSIDFIGSNPIELRTTNAMQIYNYYQMFPKIMVIDLRSTKLYNYCHLKCSVNLPVDVFDDNMFINFNPKDIIDNHLELQIDKDMFKSRKRSMVFIVAHHK